MFHSVYTRIQRCIIVTLYHRDTWLNNSYRWSFIVAIHSLTRIALFTEVDHRPHCSRSRRKSPRYSSPINCFNSFLYIEISRILLECVVWVFNFSDRVCTFWIIASSMNLRKMTIFTVRCYHFIIFIIIIFLSSFSFFWIYKDHRHRRHTLIKAIERMNTITINVPFSYLNDRIEFVGSSDQKNAALIFNH